MRHWTQMAFRNSRVRLPRTLGAVVAVSLGVAAVVWVACCYESVRSTIADWAVDYIGAADITISSPLGKYDQIPQRVVPLAAEVANVRHAAPRLLQRLFAQPIRAESVDHPAAPRDPDGLTPEVDFHGIDPLIEPHLRTYPLSAGRLLTPEDDLACVLEAAFAREHGVAVGDALLVWARAGQPPTAVEIVGLFEQRRVARFQKPIALMRLASLQKICTRFALITDVSIALERRDQNSVRTASTAILSAVRPSAPNARVRDVESRFRQVEHAQANQRVLLTLLSYVAMLTAAFIIISTLSTGLVDRVRELGLMRCIGVTRRQVATLMLLEVLPLGLLGAAIGVPLGLFLTLLTTWLVPGYVDHFTIDAPGVALAAAAGVVTTLAAGLIPMIAALRVAPLEAAHPRGRPARGWWILLAAFGAAGIFAAQRWGAIASAERSLVFLQYAVTAIVLLYFAYALLAPLLVRLVGGPVTLLAALLLRVRTKLLADQVGHAVWRSAGMCCGIMVGLSLIVAIVAVNHSIRLGWQFPRQFPEAYLWSFDPLPVRAAEELARVPGIGDFTWGYSVNVIVEERPRIGEDLLMSVTWFMGVEPDSLFRLIHLDFTEGDPATALARLREGGQIIIADDFARSRGKGLDDWVKVYVGTRFASFQVAGVIRSPAIDVAAGYFQLQSEYSLAASGSVIGNINDLRERFGMHGMNFAFFNFNLPPGEPPADWNPAALAAHRHSLTAATDETLSPAARWQRWREGQVLRELQDRMRSPRAFTGTVRELKDEIDRGLGEMTRLFTAIPLVALLVATIGVANLMTANVAARARQFAILRAIGATRGMLLRLVIGEALVLGLLGCLLGLGLGLHLAHDLSELAGRMWGYKFTLSPPWEYVAMACGLTLLLCVIAGLLPARRAARTDVVAALHVP